MLLHLACTTPASQPSPLFLVQQPDDDIFTGTEVPFPSSSHHPIYIITYLDILGVSRKWTGSIRMFANVSFLSLPLNGVVANCVADPDDQNQAQSPVRQHSPTIDLTTKDLRSSRKSVCRESTNPLLRCVLVQQSPQAQCTLRIEAQLSDAIYKARNILTLSPNKRVRPKITRTRHGINHGNLQVSERDRGHLTQARETYSVWF